MKIFFSVKQISEYWGYKFEGLCSNVMVSVVYLACCISWNKAVWAVFREVELARMIPGGLETRSYQNQIPRAKLDVKT